jgi:hypothetical protein
MHTQVIDVFCIVVIQMSKVELEQILLEWCLLEDVFGWKNYKGDHRPDQGTIKDNGVQDLVLGQEFEFGC